MSMASASIGNSSNKDAEARKNERILMELLKDETNKQCADCGQKGTRWASWNLGVFLCIRCGGLHRRLGTHISRVKSVNLDKWTDEQVQSMVEKGNAKMNALYNPNPDRFPFPSYSGDKYERKLFMRPEDRVALGNKLASTTTGGSSAQSGSNISSRSSETRYPIQMKSLAEMGFSDAMANQAALLSTGGNLQQSIEALLAGKFSNALKVSSTTTSSPSQSSTTDATSTKLGQKSTNTFDELVDIFGPPPPSATKVASPSSSKQGTASILDMDLPPIDSSSLTNIKRKDSTGDEFDEFAFAAPATTTSASSVEPSTAKSEYETRRNSEDLADRRPSVMGDEPKTSPPMRPLAGLDTTSIGGNPWASTSNNTPHTTGDAFDDLDPFRGFTAPKH